VASWLKLHRRLLEHPRAGDPGWVAVWVRLLLLAAYGRRVVVWRGKEITLEAGELVLSGRELAAAAGVDYQKVRRILVWMVADGQVVLESDSGKSLIKIVNWNLYQGKFSDAGGDAAKDAGGGFIKGLFKRICVSKKNVTTQQTTQATTQNESDAANNAVGDAVGDAVNDAVGKCVNGCFKSICVSKKNETTQLATQQTTQLATQQTTQKGVDLYKVLEGKKEEQSARAGAWGENLTDRADRTDRESVNAPGGAKEVDVSLSEWQGLLGEFQGCHPQCAGVPEMAFFAKCRAFVATADEVRVAIEEMGMDYAGTTFGASAPPLRVLGWYVERAQRMEKKDGGAAGSRGRAPSREAERKVFRGYGEGRDETGVCGDKGAE
jgi:hypothetical protein